MKELSQKLLSMSTIHLMGPGPSPVAPSVYEALGRPCIGHMDPEFIGLMDGIRTQLQDLCNTSHRATIAVSGTGTSGMETVFVNLVERGDDVLVLQNGAFGKRMIDVATRLGAQVDAVDFPWGTPVVPEKVEEALKRKQYKMVSMIHAETSTGIENPVGAVGKLVKQHGAFFVVDSVTGLGGLEVALDRWGVDAFYSGTQKCISCPPGLAPVSFSDEAMEHVRKRAAKVPNFYLDMTALMTYWDGAKRAYHHTAPCNLFFALYQALDNLLAEGKDKAIARHRAMHQRLQEGLGRLGFKPFGDPSCRLPMINLFTCPDGVDEAVLRGRLRKEHNIEIGGGLGELAGKVLRIGVLGEGARPEPVDHLIKAMAACIK